ncbi:MAG: hypothetical protein CL780_02815 [Chloroflexi bacterium]|nr:hypothetical protein [Chloroflexota bacterium]|tara:strand:- start:1822 stop:2613 length:792 start_codon:yes stop_codon:yes gene_type:complete
MKKKILITGGAGLIGSILIKKLGSKFDFSSLDIKKVKGLKSHVANLSDLDNILPAFEDIDTVIHLAADRSAEAPWNSVLKNNLIGTYNVFEAAKRLNCQRVIFASSNHASGGFYNLNPWKHIFKGKFNKLKKNSYPLIDESYRIRPDGYYGVGKAYGESIGSYYSDYHGISSMNLRIGWVISDDDPTFSPFALSLWLSHNDAAQIFKLCIEAKNSMKYGIFYATSDNDWKMFSIEKAKKILGFEPKDNAGSKFINRSPPKRDQ